MQSKFKYKFKFSLKLDINLSLKNKRQDHVSSEVKNVLFGPSYVQGISVGTQRVLSIKW